MSTIDLVMVICRVRDILHVDDICQAVEKSFSKLDDVVGEAFNISGGRENSLSVLELIEKGCEISGTQICR